VFRKGGAAKSTMPVLKRELQTCWEGRTVRGLAFGLVVIAAANMSAQLASDQVPRERTVPRSEEIRRDLDESRHRLGPIRMRPIFGIRDTGYDNNVFGTSTGNEVADWHSTVSAGADLILPLGNKMYATGIVNPEYTYYEKLTDRRLLGGEYGGSLIALFNRLSIEAGGSTDKSIAPVNSELERSAPGRVRNLFARSELEIFRRLSFFGSAQQQEQRYDLTAADIADGLSLTQLERTETFIRGGVRYRFRSYVDFSLAAENGTTDFVSARQSDNSTRAVLFGIHYDRPRLFVNVSAGTRTGQPRGAFSTFPQFSTATGSYYAAYQMSAPLAIDTYGHRSVVYGLYPNNPYYFETRSGLGMTLPVGQRIGLRAFGEIGTNAYPVASAAGLKRNDDVTLFGGGIAYRLYRKVILSIVASETRYTSNVDGLTRSIFLLGTVVSFRGDSFR
jgi:hypothetical protein